MLCTGRWGRCQRQALQTDADTLPSVLIEIATSWGRDQALAVVSLLHPLVSVIREVHGDAASERVADIARRFVAEAQWTVRLCPCGGPDLVSD
jgi:hypothetical protein